MILLYREGSDYFTFWWENVTVKALMEKTASFENFIEREIREKELMMVVMAWGERKRREEVGRFGFLEKEQ